MHWWIRKHLSVYEIKEHTDYIDKHTWEVTAPEEEFLHILYLNKALNLEVYDSSGAKIDNSFTYLKDILKPIHQKFLETNDLLPEEAKGKGFGSVGYFKNNNNEGLDFYATDFFMPCDNSYAPAMYCNAVAYNLGVKYVPVLYEKVKIELELDKLKNLIPEGSNYIVFKSHEDPECSFIVER